MNDLHVNATLYTTCTDPSKDPTIFWIPGTAFIDLKVEHEDRFCKNFINGRQFNIILLEHPTAHEFKFPDIHMSIFQLI